MRCGSHLWVGLQFLSLGSYLQSLMSRASPTRWFPGLKSRIPPKVPSLWYHFLDMPLFAYKSWLHFCGRCSTVLSDVVYFEMFHLFRFSRIDFVGLAISVHAHLVDVIIATYTEFLKVFIILWYFVISWFFYPYLGRDFLGLLTDGGRGLQNRPLPKFCHTYPTMIKLGTVISYLKKIQKTYKSCDTPNKFCSH